MIKFMPSNGYELIINKNILQQNGKTEFLALAINYVSAEWVAGNRKPLVWKSVINTVLSDFK